MGEITDALRRAQQAPHTRTAAPAAEPSPIGTSLAPSRSPSLAEWADADAPDPCGVPRDASRPHPARTVVNDSHGPVAERYRHLALRVRRVLEASRQRSLLITSPQRTEGKTVTSCNLSFALASMAATRRIALVDLDLRRPSMATSLGIEPRAGIESVLRGEEPLAAARVRTEVASLDVFLASRPSAGVHELLASPETARVLAELAQRYDTVVIDSPPVLLVPDASLIVPYVDACIAVIRARETRVHALQELLEIIPREKLIGLFLNDAASPLHARYYGYEAQAA